MCYLGWDLAEWLNKSLAPVQMLHLYTGFLPASSDRLESEGEDKAVFNKLYAKSPNWLKYWNKLVCELKQNQGPSYFPVLLVL
jgi:hypothetical protein